MGKNGSYCRINGTIHNLTKIQDILDGKSTEEMTAVLMNEYGVEFIDAVNFDTILEFCNNEIPADYNEALQRFREYNENNRSPRAYQPPKVKCPRCGSTDIMTHILTPDGELYYREKKCNKCKHFWRA